MTTIVIKNATIIGEVDSSAPPEPGKPPGIWGGGNQPFPTPPIVIPIPPDSIAPGVPAHPIWLPIYPAHPIVIPPGAIAPGVPTHPIVLPPVDPPSIWPSPGRPAHPIVIPPDAISPGVPAHPIVLPPLEIWGPTDPRPTPPIYIPGGPPGTWPGQRPPHPAHPIVTPPPGGGPGEPPNGQPPAEAGGNWQWGWNVSNGWHPVYVPNPGGKPQPVPPPLGGGETPPTDPNAPHPEPI